MERLALPEIRCGTILSMTSFENWGNGVQEFMHVYTCRINCRWFGTIYNGMPSLRYYQLGMYVKMKTDTLERLHILGRR